MAATTGYAPEVRERAVRLVVEHEREYASQWAAIGSIAEKIGCNGRRCASGCGRRSGTRGRARA